MTAERTKIIVSLGVSGSNLITDYSFLRSIFTVLLLDIDALIFKSL